MLHSMAEENLSVYLCERLRVLCETEFTTMMDIFFQDPSDIPLPPAEVRIRQFQAQPWPDSRRVRVYLETTPFQKRPSGEIKITDSQGGEVASVSIIETIDPRMEFTLHLRNPEPEGEYTVSATLFYAELDEPPDNPEDPQVPSPRVTIVDKAETSFQIGS